MPENKSKVVAELVAERRSCNFNPEEFAVWWNGGKDQLEEKRSREKVIAEDEKEDTDTPLSYLSHKELYEYSVKKSVRMLQKIRQRMPKIKVEIGDYAQSLESLRTMVTYMQGPNAISEGYPYGVHLSMFLPTILSQGTREQQAEWAPRAFDLSIIGTYAQTELGHGTFVRGLETRADFDPRKNEFILNSPTLSSYKWWPGGLAQTANYAIVLAQLYTRGVHRGLHSFIVQLRDEETHVPLPGITIGEIGPKIGMKAVNNGFLGFKNYRIPKKNMLMKNAQVLDGGAFVKSPASVLNYGTMMFVRVLIVRDASTNLAKATTIATRYSAVRRQSPIDPSKPEPQIMDHVTQQLKLFPNIAKAVVFKVTADRIWNIYNEVNAELGKGQLDRLPELHALSCCLKAVCSADASAGVEICRLACGGHGYMTASNFPSIYGFATAACTYEGENTVMLLQTARYLMKAWKQALDGVKLVPTVAYLGSYAKRNTYSGWDGSVPGIIQAFQFTAANKIRLAYEHLEKRKNSGIGPEEATNMTGIELTQAADLHCRAYLVQAGYEEIEQLSKKLPPTLVVVLRQLVELYAIDTCFIRLGDLTRFAHLTQNDVNDLQKRLEDLLTKLRPNAVGIVDGFDIPDAILKSTLGAYDGNVYERMFAEAMKSPLNQEPVNQSFHLYLKPMMKAKL